MLGQRRQLQQQRQQPPLIAADSYSRKSSGPRFFSNNPSPRASPTGSRQPNLEISHTYFINQLNIDLGALSGAVGGPVGIPGVAAAAAAGGGNVPFYTPQQTPKNTNNVGASGTNRGGVRDSLPKGEEGPRLIQQRFRSQSSTRRHLRAVSNLHQLQQGDSAMGAISNANLSAALPNGGVAEQLGQPLPNTNARITATGFRKRSPDRQASLHSQQQRGPTPGRSNHHLQQQQQQQITGTNNTSQATSPPPPPYSSAARQYSPYLLSIGQQRQPAKRQSMPNIEGVMVQEDETQMVNNGATHTVGKLRVPPHFSGNGNAPSSRSGSSRAMRFEGGATSAQTPSASLGKGSPVMFGPQSATLPLQAPQQLSTGAPPLQQQQQQQQQQQPTEGAGRKFIVSMRHKRSASSTRVRSSLPGPSSEQLQSARTQNAPLSGSATTTAAQSQGQVFQFGQPGSERKTAGNIFDRKRTKSTYQMRPDHSHLQGQSTREAVSQSFSDLRKQNNQIPAFEDLNVQEEDEGARTIDQDQKQDYDESRSAQQQGQLLKQDLNDPNRRNAPVGEAQSAATSPRRGRSPAEGGHSVPITPINQSGGRGSAANENSVQGGFLSNLQNMRYTMRTRKGAIPTNPNKVNQDSSIIVPSIGGNNWLHYFSVCDGHGANGHHVSQYLKLQFPAVLQDNLQTLERAPRQALNLAFDEVNSRLEGDSTIDIAFSGSTAVSVCFHKNSLFCANVGDSRALIGRKSAEKWTVIPLSRDHKPCDREETKRILMRGGRVDSFRTSDGRTIGPLRVWLKEEKVPGLAMTRSFGDAVAETVGVIYKPEIIEYELSVQDKIVVLASDGLWEFVSNKDVIKLVAPYYSRRDLEGACEVLMQEALRRWMQESQVIDDITIIVIFINS